MRCPNCKQKVLQKSGNTTRLRIQGAVEFVAGVCKAQCWWCKSTIDVPLELNKSLAPIDEESFTIVERGVIRR